MNVCKSSVRTACEPARRQRSQCSAIVAAVLWLLASPSALGVDCNRNGDSDALDISSSHSADCNANDIPDECEVVPLPFGERAGPRLDGVPSNVHAGDFDGDGLLDLVSCTWGSDGTSVSVLLNAGDASFQVVDYPIGTSLRDLATGDLDGDGDLDTVTVDIESVWVLLNHGDGSFAEAVKIPSTRGLTALATGDVNGDGSEDVVVTNKNTSQVLVFLSRDGDGSFASPLAFAVGESPVALAIADLDTNGSLDIVTANLLSEDLSVLHGDGDGAFSVEVRLKNLGGPPRHLLAHDLDGDGRSDLALATDTSVIALLNRGDGAFEAGSTSFLGTQVLYAGRFLRAGDVDGDGDPDLLAGYADSSKEIIAIINQDGAFERTVPLSSAAPPTDVTTGDLDADGDLDLAVATAGGIGILLAGEPATIVMSSRTISTQREPHTMTSADLDGDGDLDIATGDGGDGSVSFFLNDGNASFGIRTMPVGGSHHGITSTDLDGDGNIDLALADPRGRDVRVLLGRGNAEFEEGESFAVEFRPNFITHGDLDGDGFQDLVTTNDEGDVALFSGRGDASFAAPRLLTVGSLPLAAAVSDLDADGHLDLAVANENSQTVSVLLNDGAGAFPEIAAYDVPGASFLDAADLDGDGDLDLAVVARHQTEMALLWNEGGGVFGSMQTLRLLNYPYSVTHADLDADGDFDLITADAQDGTVSILLNQHAGEFSRAFTREAEWGARFVETGDLDGDGDVDLVSANHANRSLTVFLNERTGVSRELFLKEICTERDFQEVSIATSGDPLIERLTKFMVPVDLGDPDLLFPCFQNVGVHELHQEFLVRAFPVLFPALSRDAYDGLVNHRATRQYFAGNVYRLRIEGETLYGYSVLTDFGDPLELLTQAEVSGVYGILNAVFALEPLVYFPDHRLARENAAGWESPGFEVLVYDPAAHISYEAYTLAVGYGRVRILSSEDFREANQRGLFGFQDILVLDEAPRDIEGVVAGIVTADRQGELSHVAVRAARRGTPNAYVKNALTEFRPYEGQLVRLEIRETGYEVLPATEAEAQEFWEQNRPTLMRLPAVDPDFREFPTLDTIGQMDLEPGEFAMESIFGGKASNFARLQRILTGDHEEYREVGFAIPMHYYLEFMNSNTIPSALRPQVEVTYEGYLSELFGHEEFQTSSRFRLETLEKLRDHMREEGSVDSDLIQGLANRILEVFGTTRSRVRFRSSSNVEDALEFNGAGLYDSTSVCNADDLDADDRGPSHCDPTRKNERGVARGLRKVWASLWNYRAHEERQYYGIPPELAAMGILVSRAFTDETANGVALTGSVTGSSPDRYVITVQRGEESVVTPEPGVLPEKDVLSMENGEVVDIQRVTSSTLVDPGTLVLSDDQLRELGALLWYIDHNLSVDLGPYEREQVLIDVEFKLEPTGELAVKQVRPFLRGGAAGPTPRPTPTFELEVPDGTEVCAVFTGLDGNGIWLGPEEWYELKSTLRLTPGRVVLPTDRDSFPGELVAELVIGGRHQLAEPAGSGTFRVRRTTVNEITTYTFDYQQDFRLPGGEVLALRLLGLKFQARRNEPVERVRVADERFLHELFETQPTLEGRLGKVFGYASCTYDILPLYEVSVEAEDGSSVRLLERFQIPPNPELDTGPATLAEAEVDVRGERRRVTDYWSLIYSAGRHNRFVVYWVVLDPPLEAEGLERAVHVVEVVAPEPGFQAEDLNYLDEDLEVIASPKVVSYRRSETGEIPSPRFVRGDVRADGGVDIADALTLLDGLFGRGETLPCRKAADANDDGRLTLTDPITILLHLVGGRGPLPEPSTTCGEDPTAAELSCEVFPPCAG